MPVMRTKIRESGIIRTPVHPRPPLLRCNQEKTTLPSVCAHLCDSKSFLSHQHSVEPNFEEWILCRSNCYFIDLFVITRI